MKACTFQPKLNDDSRPERERASAIEVKGMERFLHLKDMKRKKELEKKKREDEVFRLERNYNPDKHDAYTKPKPFKLSKGNARYNRKRLTEHMADEMNKVCTFKPKTNESLAAFLSSWE